MIFVVVGGRYDRPPRSSMHDLLSVSGNVSTEGRNARTFRLYLTAQDKYFS